MRLGIGFALALAALGSAATVQAQGQPFPNRPVRVIASVQVGDTCDTTVRLVTARMAERLGQPFVVDNRVGASGMIGHALMAKAQPDGYTLGCGNGGSLAVIPNAVKDVPYDALKDFTPIALMSGNFLALMVPANSPARTVAELIQRAKQNPGKLTFGSNGEGAFLHFATENFRFQAGFTYLHVPFKGFPQITQELVAGRLDASFGSFSAVLPFMQGGRMRMLGIARAQRLPNHPDIPTLAETVPGYTSGGWFAIVGPAGIPRPIVALLNREANAALKHPEVRDKLVAQALDVYNETPEHFAKFMREDILRYGKIAKEIGLKKQ